MSFKENNIDVPGTKTNHNNPPWGSGSGELKCIEVHAALHMHCFCFQVMHDEVSETENIRKNLSIERMIIEGCDILLDVNQTFVRQGKYRFFCFCVCFKKTWRGWTKFIKVYTPEKRQSKTLLTIDERGSKIAWNSVFNCHLSQVGLIAIVPSQQMAIKISVSNDYWSTFVYSINVFDRHLPVCIYSSSVLDKIISMNYIEIYWNTINHGFLK